MPSPQQYEDEFESPEKTGEGELSQLVAYAAQLKMFDADIEAAEERLETLNKQRKHLAESVIPEAMDKIGIEALPLREGGVLRVVEKITAGIPKAREREGFAWLRDQGASDLIKRKVTVEFGKGGDNEAKALIDDLRKRKLAPEDKEAVHPQTLGAYVRERLSKGVSLPMELLGVNRLRQASVADK